MNLEDYVTLVNTRKVPIERAVLDLDVEEAPDSVGVGWDTLYTTRLQLYSQTMVRQDRLEQTIHPEEVIDGVKRRMVKDIYRTLNSDLYHLFLELETAVQYGSKDDINMAMVAMRKIIVGG